jgi:hypothetical protein
VFKIFKGLDNGDHEKFLELSCTQTRGHSLKLIKYGCNLDCRKYSFTHREIDERNNLTEDVVTGMWKFERI